MKGSGGDRIASLGVHETNEGCARNTLLPAEPDERQPGTADTALVLDRQLVGLRTAELQRFRSLAHSEKRREVFEHDQFLSEVCNIRIELSAQFTVEVKHHTFEVLESLT